MKLLDTEIIVELLRKGKYEAGAISIITLIEILRGLKPKKRVKVKELIEESFHIITINNKIIQVYCNLYQALKEKGMMIPDADLIIAATAISQNISLKTKDKHFERLKKLGLKLT